MSTGTHPAVRSTSNGAFTRLEAAGRAQRTTRARQASISDRHRVAVVQAEARRLARILQPFGILRKDQLKRRAGAASWHEGSFDSALHAAVESGEIERLPLDFYRKA
jgi:hypothetical protein